MRAVKPRGSPPPLPPRVARELHVLQYAATVVDLRSPFAPAVAGGARPHPVAGRAVTKPSGPWAQFEAIGLGPKQVVPRSRAAKAIASVYRVLGFIVLAIIVVVLLGYIATTVFYMVSRSWIVPAVVSPSDEHVLTLQTELSLQQTKRDAVAAELADANRAVDSERRFQAEFAAAMRSDLADRQAALERVRSLATRAAATRREVQQANRAFTAQQSSRLAREYEAGLADRSRMLDGKNQLAQISTSTLSLAERQAALATRADELAAAVSGLAAIVDEQPTDTSLSYDVLTIKRSYDASKLALANAIATRDMLSASLARQDKLIANLQGSGYLRAVRDHATVAVVPYENARAATAGAPLYACRAAMLLCRRVGSVLAVLPGEISVRHPHRDRTLRGRMLELKLDEPTAAQSEVLFVGGAPLWL